MKLWVLPVILAFRRVYAVPFPSFMFYPPDATVGNVAHTGVHELVSQFEGKSALVVGGTDGIGRGIALTLARCGASVIVVGHSPAKAHQTLGNLSVAAIHPSKQHFDAYAVDLITVKGALEFTNNFASSTRSRFDYVVLTVGVWPDREQPQTRDGVDKVIAADVLARFLITQQVLPLLNQGARVMSVLGSTVRYPSPPDVSIMKDLALGKRTSYAISEMLGTAGVIGDTWMQCMSARQRGRNISFVGTWPGIVSTDLVETSKTFPAWLRPWLARAEKLVAMSPEESGLIHSMILSSSNVDLRPVTYFNVNLEGRQTNPLAYDETFQQWVCSFLDDIIAGHNGTVVDDVII